MSINPSIQSYEDHFIYSVKACKQFSILKLNQEKHLKDFKTPYDNELNDLAQDVLEEGISRRNLPNHRVLYEKRISSEDYTNPSDKALTPTEMAEEVYQLIINDFGLSRNSNAFKGRYIHARDQIVKFYTRYFEIKELIKTRKEEQRLELAILRSELLDNGVPLELLNYTYKRIKTDLGIIKQGIVKDNFDHVVRVYEEVKKDILKEAL